MIRLARENTRPTNGICASPLRPNWIRRKMAHAPKEQAEVILQQIPGSL